MQAAKDYEHSQTYKNGQKFSYKQLCEFFHLTPKTGNSKIAQLKQLSQIADIEIVKSPTRYIIHKVYSMPAATSASTSQLQGEIEYLIMAMLEANKYKDLYLTNSQLLECLSLVNENFRALKNPKTRKKLPLETASLYPSASKAGEILTKWVKRALERMERKGLILHRMGFCLILAHERGQTKIEQVPMQSWLERQVLRCYRRAYEGLNLSYKDGAANWVPISLKAAFYRRFDEALANDPILKDLGLNVIGGYRANIITCEKQGVMKEIENARQSLNDESCRKIGATKQLDYMTGENRARLIEEVIKRPLPLGRRY